MSSSADEMGIKVVYFAVSEIMGILRILYAKDNICKKITTSVIEPDNMRVVLKMSYGIEWEDFLEKYLIICK